MGVKSQECNLGGLQQPGMVPLSVFYCSSSSCPELTHAVVRAVIGYCCLLLAADISQIPSLCVEFRNTGVGSALLCLTSAIIFSAISIHGSPSAAQGSPIPAWLPPISSATARPQTLHIPHAHAARMGFVLHWGSPGRAGADHFCLASDGIINKKRILTNNLPRSCSLE